MPNTINQSVLGYVLRCWIYQKLLHIRIDQVYSSSFNDLDQFNKYQNGDNSCWGLYLLPINIEIQGYICNACTNRLTNNHEC